MTEEEGHEDKLIGTDHRRSDQEYLHGCILIFASSRPIVDYFENGQSVEIGDALPVARRCSSGSPRCPGCEKRAEELAAEVACRSSSDGELRDGGDGERGRVHARRAARAQQDQQGRPRPAADTGATAIGGTGNGDLRVFQVGRIAGIPAAIGGQGLRPARRISDAVRRPRSCGTWTISRTRCPRSSS